ncbi:MAG: hypothetical protein GX126_16300 [Bacteroidales bacterium]|nr:hypothetical protein [Bacteroidales bacterium]
MDMGGCLGRLIQRATKMLKKEIFKNRYVKILICSVLMILLMLGVVPLIEVVLLKYGAPLFDIINHNIYLDIFFILLAFILIIYFVNNLVINYYNSVVHSTLSITVFFLFLYLKSEVKSIEFIRFSVNNRIAYFDIVTLYGSFSIILLVRNFLSEKIWRTESELSEGFISDKPWMQDDRDLLNRLPLAETIADQINEYNSSDSFSIGIIGKWGEGKTSFFNQIKTFLSIDRYILIDFTPWNYGHSKSIIDSYFGIFSASLSPFSSGIDDLIKKYIRLLSQNSNPGYSLLGSLVNSELSSFDHYYSKLNRTIKHINKRIIVFIDDLDRMHEIEILEIFKIIRQSSNFNNLMFIVGYDRNYISEIISGTIKSNPDAYIDKIFQLEYQLPPISKVIIEDLLKSYLNKYLPNNEEGIRLAIDSTRNEIGKVVAESVSFTNSEIESHSYLTSLITNLRDVKKIANSIILHRVNSDNVDLGEILLINIIKTKHFKLYQGIADQKILMIKKETDKVRFIVNQSKFDKIVSKDIPEYNILKQICEDIFNENKAYLKSIVFPNNFEYYFDFSARSTLAINDFNTLRLKKFKYLQKGIRKTIKNKRVGDVYLILDTIKEYTNRQDFENILRAKVLIMMLNYRDFAEDIIQSIDLSRNPDLLDRFYNGRGGIMKDTLTRIFLKKCESTYFNNFLHAVHQHFNYESNFKIALSQEEYINICIERFQRHLGYYKGINLSTFQYYYKCISKIDIDNKVIIDSRANELMRQRILSKPIEYLKIIIVDPFLPPDDISFALEGFTSQIFGGWSGFESFLYQQEQSNFIVQVIKEFYNLFKQTDYRGVRVGPDMQKKIKQIRHRE